LAVTVFGVGFGVVKAVSDKESSAVNWYLAVSLPLFLMALVWTIYRLRVDAKTKTSASPAILAVAAPMVPEVHVHVQLPPVAQVAATQDSSHELCHGCGKDVPCWFIEEIDHDGLFGPSNTRSCYHCTNGWPYPNDQESEEEYGPRLKLWKVEQKKIDEQQGIKEM
jgi:hypothetical protein